MPFAQVPEHLIAAPVKGNAFRVLVGLILHADATGRCHPSNRRLAKVTGLNSRAVVFALTELEEAGIVSKEGRTSARVFRVALTQETCASARAGNLRELTDALTQETCASARASFRHPIGTDQMNRPAGGGTTDRDSVPTPEQTKRRAFIESVARELGIEEEEPGVPNRFDLSNLLRVTDGYSEHAVASLAAVARKKSRAFMYFMGAAGKGALAEREAKASSRPHAAPSAPAVNGSGRVHVMPTATERDPWAALSAEDRRRLEATARRELPGANVAIVKARAMELARTVEGSTDGATTNEPSTGGAGGGRAGGDAA